MIPIISNVHARLEGREPIPELPFKSLWPWPSDVTPYYELMFIYCWIACLITAIGISATDALVMDLFYHVGSFFEIVSYDLDNLIKNVIGKCKIVTDIFSSVVAD